MTDSKINYNMYRVARVKSFPSGEGYVSLKDNTVIAGKTIFWVVGLDSNMKGHYAMFHEDQLEDFSIYARH